MPAVDIAPLMNSPVWKSWDPATRQEPGEGHEALAVQLDDMLGGNGWRGQHRGRYGLECSRCGGLYGRHRTALDAGGNPVFTPRGRCPGEVGTVTRAVDQVIHGAALTLRGDSGMSVCEQLHIALQDDCHRFLDAAA